MSDGAELELPWLLHGMWSAVLGSLSSHDASAEIGNNDTKINFDKVESPLDFSAESRQPSSTPLSNQAQNHPL